MSLKLDKLVQRIQDVQKIAADRASQDAAFEVIAHTLENLQKNLKTGKLVVQIVSDDLVQAQALQRLLESSSLLHEIYQFKLSRLPSLPELGAPLPMPALVMLASATQPSIRYELNSSASQVVGRNPAVAQILLPDGFALTGGQQAEIQPNGDGWQIRDLESRNGTYINGSKQRLQGWHKLQSGDRICFGSASGAAGSVTLQFERSDQQQDSALVEANRLLGCHVLCIVATANQPLSIAAKRLLAEADRPTIVKRVVVALPGGEISEAIKTKLAEATAWIESQSHTPPIHLTPLLLQPFAASPGATILTPHAQPEFERFCQSLADLASGKVEEQLLQQTMAQLSEQIAAIEAALNHQESALKAKLEQAEGKLQAIGQEKLKEQTRKAIKKVEKEKDEFFEQARNELKQSRVDLLDEMRQSGLPYKIQQFVQQLRPIVTKQGDYCYVRFQSQGTGDDVHGAASSLCYHELQRWATLEWKRICTSLKGNGLRGLLQNSDATLRFLPDINLPQTLAQVPQSVQVESILKMMVVPPMNEIRYKQMSWPGYIFKNLQSKLMSTVAPVVLITTGFGAVLGHDKLQKGLLIAAAIPIIILLLSLSYVKEKEVKAEEAGEKLRRDLANHYQSLAKNLTERLTQYLFSCLNGEERRLREALEVTSEQYAAYISEQDKNQQQLKAQIDESRKVQQKSIDSARADLQKLKREVANNK